MKTLFKNKLFVLLSAVIMLFCGIFGVKLLTPSNNANADEPGSPTLTIQSNNLSYADSFYILYAVSNDGFDRNEHTIKLLFWNELQDDYLLGTEKYAVTSNQTTTLNGKSCLVFYSNGIAAKEMTDNLYARACVEIDGDIYYSAPTKFSVLEYVYTMRARDNVTEKQSRMYNAILNFGAAAQELFDYNTNRLATSTYYAISVENGTLADGFTFGRFTDGENILLRANPTNEQGNAFLRWKDKDGNTCSNDPTFTTTITQENTYTAVYAESAGNPSFLPVFPDNTVPVADDIWRNDLYALNLETYAVAPAGFSNVTEFDWLNNPKQWALSNLIMPTSLFDATTDLSPYSDIYFAMKVIHGHLFVNGLDEVELYKGDSWVYVHYHQADDGSWLLSLNTLDGYSKTNVQTIDINSYTIELYDLSYPTLQGLMQISDAGGLCPERLTLSDNTLVYMTDVLGVLK